MTPIALPRYFTKYMFLKLQEFFEIKDDTYKGGVVDTTADLDKDFGTDDRGEGRGSDDPHRGGKKTAQQEEDERKKKEQKKKDQQKQKKLEPSLKWKNLAVEETTEK